jgi:hypothetical protein
MPNAIDSDFDTRCLTGFSFGQFGANQRLDSDSRLRRV